MNQQEALTRALVLALWAARRVFPDRKRLAIAANTEERAPVAQMTTQAHTAEAVAFAQTGLMPMLVAHWWMVFQSVSMLVSCILKIAASISYLDMAFSKVAIVLGAGSFTYTFTYAFTFTYT